MYSISNSKSDNLNAHAGMLQAPVRNLPNAILQQVVLAPFLTSKELTSASLTCFEMSKHVREVRVKWKWSVNMISLAEIKDYCKHLSPNVIKFSELRAMDAYLPKRWRKSMSESIPISVEQAFEENRYLKSIKGLIVNTGACRSRADEDILYIASRCRIVNLAVDHCNCRGSSAGKNMLIKLIEHCSDLQKLTLSRMVDSDVFEAISKSCPQMVELHLTNCSLQDQDVNKLAESFPLLRTLSINGCLIPVSLASRCLLLNNVR